MKTMPIENEKYDIFGVRVFGLSNPACKAHAPYYIDICGLSDSINIFPHYLINFTIFGKKLLFIIFCGSAAQSGLWPPHSRGFLITPKDATLSVGLLRTSNQLVAETST
jgi:hypothetical protein